MDITQIKTERQKLTANISKLINDFQESTGCTVETILLQHFITAAESVPVKTNVDIKIAIE